MTTAEATTGEVLVPSSHWWIVLLQGIASVIIGVLLFTDPAPTLVTLTLFLGVFWFIYGIFDLVRMFGDSSNWGWHLIGGILGVLCGLAIVRNPLWAAFLVPATLVWLLGIFGIVIGIMSLVQAFRGGGWGPGVLGVLSVILGLALLFGNTLVAVTILVWTVAGIAVVGGIVAIVMSFQIKSARV
ncbi:MAG: DUF308 domain-containing protein [Chloroflexi bacterium]|nr:DUF308 domain-containing protein [Chloroflexota bacterium]MBV9598977.1 DUF308 domain-containing protein [Chloroflexota bacterium]